MSFVLPLLGVFLTPRSPCPHHPRVAVCVVQEVIEDEEQAFNRTLLGGLKYFDKVKARLATEGVTVVPGKDVRGALRCFGLVAAVCSGALGWLPRCCQLPPTTQPSHPLTHQCLPD